MLRTQQPQRPSLVQDDVIVFVLLDGGLPGLSSGRAARLRPVGFGAASFSRLSRAKDGGHDRDRTCDPYHVKVVLSR